MNAVFKTLHARSGKCFQLKREIARSCLHGVDYQYWAYLLHGPNGFESVLFNWAQVERFLQNS